MKRSSQRVRELLETFQPISADARVIEVGSGAHGLIFYFGSRAWSRCRSAGSQLWKLVSALAAVCADRRGGVASRCHLPIRVSMSCFATTSSIMRSRRRRIVGELARILAPGGLLYFTVNVHHPVYAVAAGVHSSWRAVGVPYEVGPFADHTTHLTLEAAARPVSRTCRSQILSSKSNIDEARARARKQPPRHVGDRLKRVFFKNALYEVVARRI